MNATTPVAPTQPREPLMLLGGSPDESPNNGYLNIADVPQTNVNDALALSQNLPVFVEVSSNTIDDFWKLLVFNMRKREEERTHYETLPENINKPAGNKTI